MESYRKALAEVDTIIENMPRELVLKIPNQLKQVLKEEKDGNYKPEINHLVMKNDMLPETTVILGLIYRDFLCSQLEKEKLQLQDTQALQKIKKEEQEQKFDYENLFPKHEKIQKAQTQLLVEVKEKWYTKLINYWKERIQGGK